VPFRENSPLKRLKWDHTVLFAYPSCLWWLIPQPQRITALWPVLNSRPTENRQLSWPGWLITYRGGIPAPKTVTYPSTNRAQRRVTSLICTTPLPLRQTNQSINQSKFIFWAITQNYTMYIVCERSKGYHRSITLFKLAAYTHKRTQIWIFQNGEETGRETNNNMSNAGASAATTVRLSNHCTHY